MVGSWNRQALLRSPPTRGNGLQTNVSSFYQADSETTGHKIRSLCRPLERKPEVSFSEKPAAWLVHLTSCGMIARPLNAMMGATRKDWARLMHASTIQRTRKLPDGVQRGGIRKNAIKARKPDLPDQIPHNMAVYIRKPEISPLVAIGQSAVVDA